MTQPAAKMSLALKLTTTLVLVVTAAILASAAFGRSPGLVAVGAFLVVVCVACYLFAPVGYELLDGWLVVRFRLGRRRFGPVVDCAALNDIAIPRHVLLSLRLFGNGGVFAGTGFYWNRAWGVFRAYVTSARRADMVLIRTPSRAIVISPADPDAFVGGRGAPACGG
jgi:hypothetical protein